ncbi:TrbG/VirB9 family P-type conjugative transfer protein [Novosphingopyxis sp.]|uniref:TrbG/VirB9 family P-type conjugative transfer protein n=1 Tax=Novosphingopyxis sp. TaxID=2709690 RepID=UPI003B5AC43B
MRLFALLTMLCCAVPALAQTQPYSDGGDPRLQVVNYDPDEIVRLMVSPGYQLTVSFAPTERIQNIAVGASDIWLVSATARGDHLFIKPTQGGISTNMTVITDVRSYLFELLPGSSDGRNSPFALQFRYGEDLPDPAESVDTLDYAALTNWKLSGDRAIRPVEVGDDGTRVYIHWAEKQLQPAVFAIDDTGDEVLVDGYVRGDAYVIDRLFDKLVFRIGRDRAVARRPKEQARRPSGEDEAS